MSDVNSIAFIPEEVEQGCVKDLLEYLITYNKGNHTYYFDIHIGTDGYCTIVEFAHLPYDHSYGGTFTYVDEDHEVLKEVRFPDNHIEYLYDNEEDEAMAEFLTANPQYEKDQYGNWREKISCEDMI